MPQQQDPDWPTCEVDDDCIGVQLDDADDQGCLNHTSDDGGRERWWHKIGQGKPLDARGLTFTTEQLQQLLDRTPRDDQDGPRIREADFTRATFTGDARFGGATFEGDAQFGEAAFQGNALFDRATFNGHASFGEAAFQGNAFFGRATFNGHASFGEAEFSRRLSCFQATFHRIASFAKATFHADADFCKTDFHYVAGFPLTRFEGYARFEETTFHGIADFVQTRFGSPAVLFYHAIFRSASEFTDAVFEGGGTFGWTTFEGNAEFVRTTFRGDAVFHEARFHSGFLFKQLAVEGQANFERATFQSDARIDRATFHRDAVFRKAIFQSDTVLAPIIVALRLDLSLSAFASRLDLQVAAPHIDFTRSRLANGGHLRVGWAHVDLTEAEIPEPCILEDGADLLRQQHALWKPLNSEPLPQALTWTFLLESLQRATVTGLVLGAVDVSGCRFAGAHDLDQLRVPHTAQLKRPPSRLLASRRVLAEEILWRQHKWKRRHWPVNRSWQRASLDASVGADDAPPPPSDIAELYRALRTGRETRGDEPGAADFYYGEMEMRRHNLDAPRAERFVLWWYWALSGYALRASRALVWLALVLAASTVYLSGAFQDPVASDPTVTVEVGGQPVAIRVGGPPQADAPPVEPQRRWGDAARASVESVILRAPNAEDELTDIGRDVTTAMRFVGPILLALAVLSVRGRVKR